MSHVLRFALLALPFALAPTACVGEDPAVGSSGGVLPDGGGTNNGGQPDAGPTCKGDTVDACGPSCTKCTAPASGTVSCTNGACEKACEGKTLCGDACVDLDSSGDHCGKCGRSCEGGQCQQKVCQPVQIAGGLTNTHSIDLSPSGVIISADHDISRCDLPGGCSAATLKAVTTAASELGDAVVSGTDVFWTSSQGDYVQVLKCPVTGCPADLSTAVVEVIVNDGVSRVVVGPTHAVWSRTNSYYGTYIQACALPACSSVFTVKQKPANPNDPARETAIPITLMAAGAANVFYATGIYNDGSPTLRSHNLTASAQPTNLGNDGNAVYALTYGNGKLYGASRANNGSANSIGSIDDGQTEKKPLATDAAGVTDIAVDATGIYWANGTTGKIQKCALSGCGGGELLAGGQAGAKRIRVDGKFVYWLTATAVMRVVK